MSKPTYWLCLFNKTTWQEFLTAGGDVMGFPQTRQNTIKRIKPGDFLLGYMTGISKWMAVLEVTSESYFDAETKIWQQASFPCRIKVKPTLQVEPEQGIPALSLSKEMRLFDNLKTPHWGLLFRIAPRELHPEDGELIVNAIRNIP
ncbi:MAG: EVE domain-containing protein [Leptolyngbyaceae bacterium]|nr:EVE domain-containing protein [Leptolyngbyaceae bacterium]